MKRIMVVLGFVVVLVFGTTYVYAQAPAGHTGHKETVETSHPHKGMEAGKGLSFTDEQKAKFRDLRRDFRRDNAQLIGTVVAKRIELQALWTDPKAEPKAIVDKAKELREVQNQLREKFTSVMLEARKLLTPEQIANLKPGWFWGEGHGKGHRQGHSMGHCGMMAHGEMMGHRGMMGHGGHGGMTGHGKMMGHECGMCK